MRIIYGKKWYRPREVADLGLITSNYGNNSPTGNHSFIMKLINNGELAVRNYGRKSVPRYLISETAIEKYLKNVSDEE